MLSVNYRILSVKGCVTLRVELQDLLCEHEFIVVDDLIYPIILGLDFIISNSLKLEFAPKCITHDLCACSVKSERDNETDNEEFFLRSVDPESYCLPHVPANDMELRELMEEYKDIFRITPGVLNLLNMTFR